VLIARRYRGKPEVVGFGVVVGRFKKSFKPQYKFGSLRKLSPFKPRSAAPPKLPIMNALGQTTVLTQTSPAETCGCPNLSAEKRRVSTHLPQAEHKRSHILAKVYPASCSGTA